MTEANTPPSGLPQVTWPAWLTSVGPEAPASLRKFDEASQRFRDAYKDGYSYRYVSNEHVNAFVDSAVSGGRVDPSRVGPLTAKQYAMVVAQNSSAHQMLGTLIAAKQMTVAQLVDAARSASASNHVLITLSLLRALIEHIAHFDAVITKLRECPSPTAFKDANEALARIRSLCTKALFATRFDWAKLRAVHPRDLLQEKRLDYTPEENREDRTAKSILNAIDGLGKSVPGVRVIYEWLCEFAHPNVGMLLSVTEIWQVKPDAHGVPWVEKRLTMGAPSAFIQDLGPVLNLILDVCASSLGRLEELLGHAGGERAKVLAITQIVVRQLMSRGGDAFDPYELCPCGGGLKVRSCCGKRVQ